MERVESSYISKPELNVSISLEVKVNVSAGQVDLLVSVGTLKRNNICWFQTIYQKRHFHKCVDAR